MVRKGLVRRMADFIRQENALLRAKPRRRVSIRREVNIVDVYVGTLLRTLDVLEWARV